MFNKKGFTLVELLVVVFIIGILASVVLVATSSARSKSRDDKRKVDVDTIAQAAEMYYSQNRKYPCASCTNFNTLNWAALQNDLGSYISAWPDNSKGDYIYAVNNTAKKYVIDAKLERKTDTTTACVDNVDNAVSDTCYASDNSSHYRRVSQ
ncbi:MAG: type II secretion system GspH family protein [Patescibacteria group bacterium]|nr:type II secretion system GspH family protein [Patescibacteria group bacterium]